MFSHDPSLTNHLRYERLLAEAASARLASGAAPLPAVPWHERVASARRALGYRLVEAGLRLAVGPVTPRHAPPMGSRPPP